MIHELIITTVKITNKATIFSLEAIYGINVPRTKKNIIRANAIAQINFNINLPPLKNTKVILKYNYSVLKIRFLLVCTKNYRKWVQKTDVFCSVYPG